MMLITEEKYIKFELELIGRVSDNYDPLQVFKIKDVNDVYGVKDKIINFKLYGLDKDTDCEGFYDMDDDYIFELGVNDPAALYNDEYELYSKLQKVIKEYLKVNKLPDDYKDEDISDVRNLTTDIACKIIDGVTGEVNKLDIDSTSRINWKYEDGVFTLWDKYLTKKGEVKVSEENVIDLDDFILEFNKEWNRMIDGKYER